MGNIGFFPDLRGSGRGGQPGKSSRGVVLARREDVDGVL
jgi:hypothetical protein